MIKYIITKDISSKDLAGAEKLPLTALKLRLTFMWHLKEHKRAAVSKETRIPP